MMALTNATTNERSKRSDLLYYNENKLEFLEYWLSNFKGFKLGPKDKKFYHVEDKLN